MLTNPLFLARIGLIFITVLASGFAYTMYLKNALIKTELKQSLEAVENLELAAEQNEVQTQELITNLEKANAQLLEATNALSELQKDPAVADYLNTDVPDGVKRVLKKGTTSEDLKTVEGTTTIVPKSRPARTKQESGRSKRLHNRKK